MARIDTTGIDKRELGAPELDMKKLLALLQEIAPGEITEKSLCFLLHIKSHTAKRLLNGKIKWPNESTWYKNACNMAEEVEKAYNQECETVLKGRSKKDLTTQECKQLWDVKESFGAKLEEKYRNVGIFRLQACCYFPKNDLGFTFDKRLTLLVTEVLRNTEQFQEIKGKEYLLNFLHRNNGAHSDIGEIERIEEDQYEDMAKFLVDRVAWNQNKASTRSDRANSKETDSGREDGNEADCRKANNRTQIRAEEMETWESSAFLLDQHWKRIGTWSYLILTEEQEERFRKGTFFESKFPELIFLPGDYVLYIPHISYFIDGGLINPENFQEIVDAMLRKLRFFIERGRGIYFKRLCINIPDPISEGFYRNIGFRFTMKSFLSGHIYVQSLIPFPAFLKTKEPDLLSELKRIYDGHFLG